MNKLAAKKKLLFGNNSLTNPRMIIARQKQSRALHLRLMGLNFQQIADSEWPMAANKPVLVGMEGKPAGKLYKSRKSAHKAVLRELELCEGEQASMLDKTLSHCKKMQAEAARERYVDMERLAMLLNKVMPKALAGDTKASDIALKIITARATLGGYLPVADYQRRKAIKPEPYGGIPAMLKAAKERKAKMAEAIN